MEIGRRRKSSDRERRHSSRSSGQSTVITKGKPVHLSRPVKKLYPPEIRSKREGTRTKSTRNQVLTRNAPPRSAALDSTWKMQLMLDS